MRRPKPDANNCADCWEENCSGCEIWNKAYGEAEESDEDDEETEDEDA